MIQAFKELGVFLLFGGGAVIAVVILYKMSDIAFTLAVRRVESRKTVRNGKAYGTRIVRKRGR